MINVEEVRRYFAKLAGNHDITGRPTHPRVPATKSTEEIPPTKAITRTTTVYDSAQRQLERAEYIADFEERYGREYEP